MEECPFCGEPIDGQAEFCRHCGSDAETGWNPDADYESVELPEEEEAEAERPRSSREEPRDQIRKLLGPALVVSSWFFFVVLASGHFRHPALVLIPAVYLAATILIVSRLAARSDERRARRPVRR